MCEVQSLSDGNDTRTQQPKYITCPGIVLVLAIGDILKLAG